MRNQGHQVSFALILLVTSMSGCSLLSVASDPADPSFRARAASTESPVAVPADVALEMTSIAKRRIALAPSQDVVVRDGDSSGQAATSQPSEAQPSLNSTQSRPHTRSKGRRPAASTATVRQGSDQTGRAEATQHTVSPGDTLMKIAFQYYGDLLKWREIYEANKATIGGNAARLEPGIVLTINGREYIMVERNGKPYLILRNDTLTKISSKVYGTPVHWRELWQNNRQLIRHPDRIYAGLTLYYRDLAEPVSPREPAAAVAPVRELAPAANDREATLKRLKAHPARDP